MEQESELLSMQIKQFYLTLPDTSLTLRNNLEKQTAYLNSIEFS